MPRRNRTSSDYDASAIWGCLGVLAGASVIGAAAVLFLAPVIFAESYITETFPQIAESLGDSLSGYLFGVYVLMLLALLILSIWIAGRVKRRKTAVQPPSNESLSERVDKKPRREPIPKSVKMYVWQRDQGRCVECGSKERLEYDHIIPVSKGGSNTDRNIQLLCERCNRSKGSSIA